MIATISSSERSPGTAFVPMIQYFSRIWYLHYVCSFLSWKNPGTVYFLHAAKRRSRYLWSSRSALSIYNCIRNSKRQLWKLLHSHLHHTFFVCLLQLLLSKEAKVHKWFVVVSYHLSSSDWMPGKQSMSSIVIVKWRLLQKRFSSSTLNRKQWSRVVHVLYRPWFSALLVCWNVFEFRNSSFSPKYVLKWYRKCSVNACKWGSSSGSSHTIKPFHTSIASTALAFTSAELRTYTSPSMYKSFVNIR